MSAVNVSLMDRNYPYGLLQFSLGSPPLADGSVIPPASEKPQVMIFVHSIQDS